MNKVIKRIIIILVILALGALVAFASYHIFEKYIKKADLYLTYEDNDGYVIPVVDVMTEEEALKEWPYIMHLENRGKRDTDYKLVIKDKDGDIKREYLSYLLMEDDKKVASGKLSDLKDNIIYNGTIKGNKKITKENEKHDYKLYIWVNKKIDGTKYEYSITLEFNK